MNILIRNNININASTQILKFYSLVVSPSKFAAYDTSNMTSHEVICIFRK